MKIISAEVFGAYLNCPTKCWLRAANHPQAGSVYSEWIKAENDSYRTVGRERLVTGLTRDEFAHLRHMESIKVARWRLALGLSVHWKMDSCVLESELQPVTGRLRRRRLAVGPTDPETH
jgi:hypothetical protein